MDYKDFRVNISIRVILIVLTSFAIVYMSQTGTILITKIFLWGLLVYQAVKLITLINKINNEVFNFLRSIKYDDFSHTYPVSSKGSSMDLLNMEFNKVMNKFKEIRAEKEAQYHYFRTIVQHLGIGIITFKKNGEIQIINTAAKRLFQVDQIRNISTLEVISPGLVESFRNLKTGGRDLIKIEQSGEIINLSIFVIELTLRGEEFKLVSVQNIQSELEEKEMEAWQNLIRVLTHEIMNSVTPISSLAATMDDEIDFICKKLKEEEVLKEEDFEDIHLAAQTILRRSKGLIKFVSDFRNLTRIPAPKLSCIELKELFDQLLILLRKDLVERKVNFKVKLDNEALSINADKDLIEQVLINLIKNAMEAFDNEDQSKEKVVTLEAIQDEKSRVLIKVTDNGSGIDPEALNKIFIPFFTTKRNGSGIGLSLSKQIMRQHGGSITVKSELNKGTEFALKF
jgi:two-component system, NtrC family, nitrogen regulation sensor histidine kinase NtrY